MKTMKGGLIIVSSGILKKAKPLFSEVVVEKTEVFSCCILIDGESS